jgi:hypothetical protein
MQSYFRDSTLDTWNRDHKQFLVDEKWCEYTDNL